MAFDIKGLMTVAQGAANTAGADQSGYRSQFYHYSTQDTHAVVLAANYFNNAAKILNKGDFIFATVLSAGLNEARCYVVRSNTAGVVTIVQQIFTA